MVFMVVVVIVVVVDVMVVVVVSKASLSLWQGLAGVTRRLQLLS